jgi:hypothetical protein
MIKFKILQYPEILIKLNNDLLKFELSTISLLNDLLKFEEMYLKKSKNICPINCILTLSIEKMERIKDYESKKVKIQS